MKVGTFSAKKRREFRVCEGISLCGSEGWGLGERGGVDLASGQGF